MKKLKSTLLTALNSNCSKDISRFHEECYEELFEKIFLIAAKYSLQNAEDLTQDIFEKIFKIEITKLEAHLGHLDKYFLKTAKNYCLDFIKKRKNLVDLDYALLITETPIMSIERKIDFENSIGTIPQRQALAIRKKMSGYKIEEIAEELKTTTGAVKNLIYYGKRNIKAYYLS